MQPIAQAVLLNLPRRKARDSHGGLWHGCRRGVHHRPDARRLDHLQLRLAPDFLHQPPCWRGRAV